MISKEHFNKIWSKSSRKSILNQFYYEHNELQELYKKINSAIDKLFCWGEALDPLFQKEMLEILGENNE